MHQEITPIPVRPWTLNGLSERLIVSHYWVSMRRRPRRSLRLVRSRGRARHAAGRGRIDNNCSKLRWLTP